MLSSFWNHHWRAVLIVVALLVAFIWGVAVGQHITL